MARKNIGYPSFLKKLREQLDLSQEKLAHEIGVSFATVNRWENAQAKPSIQAKAQLDEFCIRMIKEGKVKLPRSSVELLR